MTDLVPVNVAPGLVPIGFSESVLKRALEVDDLSVLADAASTFAGLLAPVHVGGGNVKQRGICPVCGVTWRLTEAGRAVLEAEKP